MIYDDDDPLKILIKDGFNWSIDNETGRKAYELADKNLSKAKLIKKIDVDSGGKRTRHSSPIAILELDGEQYKTYGEAGYGMILAKTKRAIKKLIH